MLPGTRPRSPTPARMAPLRVIHRRRASDLLELGVVVVAVDLVGRMDLPPELRLELTMGGHEQLPSVLTRVPLGPPQIADVGVELGRALLEPGELRILEPRAESLVQAPGDLRVQRGELVPAPTRPGVQQDPDDALLVDGQLDEVVARAQRAELGRRSIGVCQRLRRRMFGEPLERVRRRLAVPVSESRGHAASHAIDPPVQAPVRQLVDPQIEPTGGHAAPDVDADRRRDHRGLGRDHRPDRRAHAEVGVGHEGDVARDDRQPRGALGLLPRGLVELARPAEHAGGDLVGHRAVHPCVCSGSSARSARRISASSTAAPCGPS